MSERNRVAESSRKGAADVLALYEALRSAQCDGSKVFDEFHNIWNVFDLSSVKVSRTQLQELILGHPVSAWVREEYRETLVDKVGSVKLARGGRWCMPTGFTDVGLVQSVWLDPCRHGSGSGYPVPGSGYPGYLTDVFANLSVLRGGRRTSRTVDQPLGTYCCPKFVGSLASFATLFAVDRIRVLHLVEAQNIKGKCLC